MKIKRFSGCSVGPHILYTLVCFRKQLRFYQTIICFILVSKTRTILLSTNSGSSFLTLPLVVFGPPQHSYLYPRPPQLNFFLPFFMTMLLSSARDLIASHSSILKSEYLLGISVSLKGSCSTLLKNTSKLGYPVGGFHDDLDRNAGISLKLFEGLFQKCHFICIRLQNSSKSCFNSGSLTFLCISTKCNHFSKTLISSSDSTLLLKLKLVSEQK